MTLQEFVQQLPSTILQKGRNYFENGSILNLTKNHTTWQAVVEGSYGNYRIYLNLNHEDKVESYRCNCPYDGAVCKHIAAVALAVIENNSNVALSNKESNPSHSKALWEQLIQKSKPEELKAFLMDYGQQNPDFRHQIEHTLYEPTEKKDQINIEYYRNKINGIFDRYDYQGYMDYRSGRKAMDDVDEFLQKRDRYFAKENHCEAFSIAAAVAMEGIEAIQHMDDSSGECGGAVRESFEMIEKILKASTITPFNLQVFEWLTEQVQNDDYNEYGLGDELVPLFFETANSLRQLDFAYQFLDKKIQELEKEEGWNKEYQTEQYLMYKINLLRSEQREVEVMALVNENLNFPMIRQLQVDQYLSQLAYGKAEGLILEGINLAQKENYSGTVHEWKDQLLAVYEKNGESKKYHELARELFIENSSNIGYFKILKKSTETNNWIEKRDGIIAEMKNKQTRYSRGVPLDDLASVYIQEQMVDELFKLVVSSKHIETIISYTDHLKAAYPSELLGCYKTAIEKEAKNSGRNVYVALVSHLKKMSKLKGGLKAAMQLKKELLETYKNRPAMKSEFHQLNWE